MNTHVNFETAKLLKEKGFSNGTNGCLVHYKTENKHHEDGTSGPFGWKKDEMTFDRSYIVNGREDLGDLSNNSYDCYERPTITETIMWLYKKHGIWICVYTMDKWMSGGNDKEQLFDYGIKQMKLGLIDIPKKPEEFNSPTEVYQEAIAHTLKNLI